jgi:hypothetical protein
VDQEEAVVDEFERRPKQAGGGGAGLDEANGRAAGGHALTSLGELRAAHVDADDVPLRADQFGQ